MSQPNFTNDDAGFGNLNGCSPVGHKLTLTASGLMLARRPMRLAAMSLVFIMRPFFPGGNRPANISNFCVVDTTD